MSNFAFDQLSKRLELQNARQALAAYEGARKRDDLTNDEIEFLDRAIAGQKDRVENAKWMIRQWHQ